MLIHKRIRRELTSNVRRSLVQDNQTVLPLLLTHNGRRRPGHLARALLILERGEPRSVEREVEVDLGGHVRARARVVRSFATLVAFG